MTLARYEFRAMGTTFELLLEGEPGAAFAEVEAGVARLEQMLTRFRPDSELSRLNARGALDASPELAEVAELSLAARLRTGGRFDPTVHDAILAAGYDRTFAELPADGPPAGPAAPGGGGFRVEGRRIVLEPGVRLDFGGIGKGFAAERAAERLALLGPCLVSAGGDVAVRGVPAKGFWAVAVEDGPTLALTAGGLATSGSDRRRWLRAGREQHHLIDPATGLPARSDLLRVTAIGSDAVDAEVLAKWLYLGGRAEAEQAGVPAVLVTAAGETLLVGGIA
ncbi:MAG TPA: FAD:protein FMN transferase [Gaiellaceae bacterium]|nr:FAD:protein FMN transferase [Gaiellaceae bacterium]